MTVVLLNMFSDPLYTTDNNATYRLPTLCLGTSIGVGYPNEPSCDFTAKTLEYK